MWLVGGGGTSSLRMSHSPPPFANSRKSQFRFCFRISLVAISCRWIFLRATPPFTPRLQSNADSRISSSSSLLLKIANCDLPIPLIRQFINSSITSLRQLTLCVNITEKSGKMPRKKSRKAIKIKVEVQSPPLSLPISIKLGLLSRRPAPPLSPAPAPAPAPASTRRNQRRQSTKKQRINTNIRHPEVKITKAEQKSAYNEDAIATAKLSNDPQCLEKCMAILQEEFGSNRKISPVKVDPGMPFNVVKNPLLKFPQTRDDYFVNPLYNPENGKEKMKEDKPWPFPLTKPILKQEVKSWLRYKWFLYKLGDVVVVPMGGKYAEIVGFFSDQFCEKYVKLRWLIQRDSVKFDFREFRRDWFIEGLVHPTPVNIRSVALIHRLPEMKKNLDQQAVESVDGVKIDMKESSFFVSSVTSTRTHPFPKYDSRKQ